jgi:hypothetical protein
MASAFEQMRSAFLSITGYGPSELLSANAESRTFMTRNGGRYQLSEDLKRVKRLAGPSWRVEER